MPGERTEALELGGRRGKWVWEEAGLLAAIWSPAATHICQRVVRACGEGGHRGLRGHREAVTAHACSGSGGEHVAAGSRWVLKGKEMFSQWRSGGEEVELKGWRQDSGRGQNKSAET